jgi:quinol monooxygenase YgiN
MPITSLLDLQLKPDAVDAALPILQGVLADTRAFDGCLGVTVIQDTTDPTRFIAVERWQSLEHDTAYRQWRAGDGAAGLSALPSLLAGPPKLTIATDRDDI